LIFKRIPMHIFENFHNMFIGSSENTFKICQECRGACEHDKIGTLLPGEKEYMAEKMGISVSEFKVRYLDILIMNDGTRLDVLKLGKLCPFLNEENEKCECRDFKPILCKVYPIIFTLEANKISFIIDNWCQLSRKKSCRIYFESVIPLLSNLPLSVEWFKYVVNYDSFSFDCSKLEKSRRVKKKCAIFSLDELLSLRKNEIETASLCIDFGQEVKEPIF